MVESPRRSATHAASNLRSARIDTKDSGVFKLKDSIFGNAKYSFLELDDLQISQNDRDHAVRASESRIKKRIWVEPWMVPQGGPDIIIVIWWVVWDFREGISRKNRDEAHV